MKKNIKKSHVGIKPMPLAWCANVLVNYAMRDLDGCMLNGLLKPVRHTVHHRI